MGFISRLVTKACVAYLDFAGQPITSAIQKQRRLEITFKSSRSNVDSDAAGYAMQHTPEGYVLNSFSTIVVDNGTGVFCIKVSAIYVEKPSRVILEHLEQLAKRNDAAKDVKIKWN